MQGQGITVIATLLPHEPRDHLAQPNIHVFNSDVTKDEDTTELRMKIEGLTNGRLDFLVNNA